jgi:hypothetical protein
MALNADGPPMGVGRLKSLHVKRALPRGKVNFAVGRLDKAGLARDLALGVSKDSGLERDSKPDTAASGPGLAVSCNPTLPRQGLVLHGLFVMSHAPAGLDSDTALQPAKTRWF